MVHMVPPKMATKRGPAPIHPTNATAVGLLSGLRNALGKTLKADDDFQTLADPLVRHPNKVEIQLLRKKVSLLKFFETLSNAGRFKS